MRCQPYSYLAASHTVSHPETGPRRDGQGTGGTMMRLDLAEALAAAFSLYRTPPWADRRSTEDMRTRQQVLDVLDSVRFRHHPAGDWDSFFDALWERRSELRNDL